MGSADKFAGALGRADVPLLVLALSLAVIALYAGNIASRLFDAIAREETGFKGPLPDDHRFIDRAQRPEFILLLVTAAGAAQGVNWSMSLPLCLAGLSIARMPKYVRLWPRAAEINAEWQVLLTIAGSTILSLANALAMIAVGAIAGWLVH
ncbi:MAG: hypothetical protein JSS20_20200 [Proteobacteria bacterium]|nr:hypothetical protein [Pseudomonadota bacterium]